MRIAPMVRLFVVVAALAALTPAALVGAAEKEQKGKTYVGTVEGTDAYIGIVVGKSGAFAYLCDGEGIAHWLRGSVDGDAVTLLASTGASVVATLDGRSLAGTAVIPADPASAEAGSLLGVTVHEFRAARSKGDAGLYRQEKSVDGATYAAGWVRLADGSLRGDVTVVRPAADGTAPTAAPTTSPPATAAPTTPPTTAAPTRSVVVPPDVGTSVAGQIAPPEVQSSFPATPRRASVVVTTFVSVRACVIAQQEFGVALQRWLDGGQPLSGPLFEATEAAANNLQAKCGTTSLG